MELIDVCGLVADVLVRDLLWETSVASAIGGLVSVWWKSVMDYLEFDQRFDA